VSASTRICGFELRFDITNEHTTLIRYTNKTESLKNDIPTIHRQSRVFRYRHFSARASRRSEAKLPVRSPDNTHYRKLTESAACARKWRLRANRVKRSSMRQGTSAQSICTVVVGPFSSVVAPVFLAVLRECSESSFLAAHGIL